MTKNSPELNATQPVIKPLLLVVFLSYN